MLEVTQELEAALCAPNWAASLTHVHNAEAALATALAEREAYRTADESGSPEAAGTVAWNWIGEMAQVLRKADAVLVEIVSEPVEGGGRVTRLYRGSTLMAVATTFRDTMNYTVFTRWVAPELALAERECERAEIARLRLNMKRLLQYEGHMVYCGHGKDEMKPCVCGLLKAQDDARATLSGETP